MRFIKLVTGEYLNAARVDMLEVLEDYEQNGLFNVIASTKTQRFCIDEGLSQQEAEKELRELIEALED